MSTLELVLAADFRKLPRGTDGECGLREFGFFYKV